MNRIASLLVGLSLALSPALAFSGAPVLSFGAPIALEETTPLAQIVAHPERFADGPVLVRGRIADVCQKKGCWTVLTDGAAQVRVNFKDYGFFLPTDIRGRTALAEGQVTVEVQSQETARHYAAESLNGDPEAILGEQRVVAFTASGLRLLKTED